MIMNMERNKLYSVIKSSLALSLATCLTTTVYAQEAEEEEEAAELDKVLVTGSRIKRVDVETAQPVTIITREDIDLSGDTSVAEVLRNLSANTFGSWKGMSGYGSGAPGSVEVDLRGVSATLVLIDGRRMPGAGYDGGATQNLNNIPLAIVERIEVLRGGASAIYGSDAIGGVINIITLNELDGGAVSYLIEDRSVDDGNVKQFEFAAGMTGDRGNILITAQHTSVDELEDNMISGFDNGTSWWGPVTNVFYLDKNTGGYESWFEPSLCEQIPNTVDQGYRCGYAYSNVTWHYPKQTRDSIFAKMNYELTPNITFHARMGYVGNRTISRYAPTPVSTNTITMQSDNPNAPQYLVDNIWDVYDPNIYLYHRSALLGTRDAYFNDVSYDLVFGLDGFLDAFSGLDWQVNYQYTVKSEDVHNTNLINDISFQNGIDDGSFDIFNVQGRSISDYSEHASDFYLSAAHTGIYEVRNVRNLFDGNIGGELWYSDNMSLSAVVGLEIENTDFRQVSDPASGQGFISGGSGGDDVFATRDRLSAYAELAVDFNFGLELSAAIRYDEYDQDGDIGSEIANRKFDDTTSMVTAAWRPTDNLLLRAVAGTAFRAPTMPELFASRSFGFPSGYDYYYCDTQGNPGNDVAYCDASNRPQHLTYSGGNPTLGPETADTLSIGFVWQVTDNFSVEAGWYDIEYVDKIVGIGVNDILLLNQAAGGDTSNVVRDNQGKIVSIQSGTINLDSQETDGIDVAISYALNTDSWGSFAFRADATKVLNFTDSDNDSSIERTGEFDYPDLRANSTLSWSLGNWYAAWRMNYIAGQDAPEDSTSFINIDSRVYHNLQVGYHLPWDAEMTLGARNVSKEKVQFYTDDGGWRNYNSQLYTPEGRTMYFKYKQSF
jgi:outer membrane receptor protein involved in Fe transport